MPQTDVIIGKFAIKGEVLQVKPLGNGLINDTYKVTTAGDAPDYVLQRINNAIFQDVDLLQHNIEAVTRHIRKKLVEAGESDIDRKVLTFVPLKDASKTYYFDGESYWRVSVFIPDAFTYDTVDPKYSRFAGEAFGRFEAQLADIPGRSRRRRQGRPPQGPRSKGHPGGNQQIQVRHVPWRTPLP